VREPLKHPEPSAEHGPATVAIRIPALPEWVGVARLATAGIASRSGFSIEDIEDLKLAVAEACNCCIQNPGRGDVNIECVLDDRRITITVTRAGAGPARTSEPAPTGEFSAAGGLGVFLIRSLMDDVTYVSDKISGTRLTLTKVVGT